MYSDEHLKARIAELVKMGIIDPYSRRQPTLNIKHLFPFDEEKHVCRCGCGGELPFKYRRWSTTDCNEKAMEVYGIVKGFNNVIRLALAKRDGQRCRVCNKDCSHPSYKGMELTHAWMLGNWVADHIQPIGEGGGGCLLDNFQTLCTYHDKIKSMLDKRRIAEKKRKLVAISKAKQGKH